MNTIRIVRPKLFVQTKPNISNQLLDEIENAKLIYPDTIIGIPTDEGYIRAISIEIKPDNDQKFVSILLGLQFQSQYPQMIPKIDLLEHEFLSQNQICEIYQQLFDLSLDLIGQQMLFPILVKAKELVNYYNELEGQNRKFTTNLYDIYQQEEKNKKKLEAKQLKQTLHIEKENNIDDEIQLRQKWLEERDKVTTIEEVDLFPMKTPKIQQWQNFTNQELFIIHLLKITCKQSSFNNYKQIQNLMLQFQITSNKELVKLLSPKYEILFQNLYNRKFEQYVRQECELIEFKIAESKQLNNKIDKAIIDRQNLINYLFQPLNKSSSSSHQKVLENQNSQQLVITSQKPRNDGIEFNRMQSDFEIVDILGKGSFGEVIKAKNKIDGRYYAIKKIKVPQGQTLDRILREVDLLSRLHHRHVIRYYQAWIDECQENDISEPFSDDEESLEFQSEFSQKSNSYIFETSQMSSYQKNKNSLTRLHQNKKIQVLYIQTEFCTQTLRDAISTEYKKADIPFIWNHFRQILEAMLYTHKQRIIHRDLKPENIFIDTIGDIKIGDFGLAKHTSHHNVLYTNTVSEDANIQDIMAFIVNNNNNDEELKMLDKTLNVGTYFYTPPKQDQSNQFDEKRDVYALGIILFEMWCQFRSQKERLSQLKLLRDKGELRKDFEANHRRQASLIKWMVNHNAEERPTIQDILNSDILPPRNEDEYYKEAIKVIHNQNIESLQYKQLIEALFKNKQKQFWQKQNHSKYPSLFMTQQYMPQIYRYLYSQCTVQIYTNIFDDKLRQDDQVQYISKSGETVVLRSSLRRNFVNYLRNINQRLFQSKYIKTFEIGDVYKVSNIIEIEKWLNFDQMMMGDSAAINTIITSIGLIEQLNLKITKIKINYQPLAVQLLQKYVSQQDSEQIYTYLTYIVNYHNSLNFTKLKSFIQNDTQNQTSKLLVKSYHEQIDKILALFTFKQALEENTIAEIFNWVEYFKPYQKFLQEFFIKFYQYYKKPIQFIYDSCVSNQSLLFDQGFHYVIEVNQNQPLLFGGTYFKNINKLNTICQIAIDHKGVEINQDYFSCPTTSRQNSISKMDTIPLSKVNSDQSNNMKIAQVQKQKLEVSGFSINIEQLEQILFPQPEQQKTSNLKDLQHTLFRYQVFICSDKANKQSQLQDIKKQFYQTCLSNDVQALMFTDEDQLPFEDQVQLAERFDIQLLVIIREKLFSAKQKVVIKQRRDKSKKDKEMSLEEFKYSFVFKLDLTLLNVLRSFTHQDHEFTQGYLESIYALLYYYQGKPESELFSEYCSQHGNLTIEALIFQIHFYIASIANLQQLMPVLGLDEARINSLSKSDINKTNILSVHSIMDRVGLIDHALLVQKSKSIQPEYLNIPIKIVTYDYQDDNFLLFKYQKVSLGIQAKGKLDPYVTSYLANLLNKRYNLQLFHILLSFADKKSQATENYSERFDIIFKGVENFSFRRDRFRQFRDKLVQLSYGNINVEEITKLLSDIDSEVGKSIIARDLRSNHYLEKLLIGMLGNPIQLIRDQAVICLNLLYDGVDWQKRSPYKPKISKVGSQFIIDYLFEWDQSFSLNQIVLLLKSYISDPGCKQNIVSWHKPKFREYYQQGDKKYITFTMDFGVYKRCGFYDWKLVRMTPQGKLQSLYKILNMENSQSQFDFTSIQTIETKPIQGRFIVHPLEARQLQIHEIYIDILDAKTDQQGKFSKRGNFRKIKDKLVDLQNHGINCVYLMGVLERDNGMYLDEKSRQRIFKRPEVSPMAITCRQTPNTMLGGPDEFRQLVKYAQDIKMKIVIDSLIRISSARPSQRYKKHLVQRLDDQGKLIPIYGTDGRSLSFEDTFVLNMRKKKVWDLYLEELVNFVQKYPIFGIQLDNGSAWPQIFILDAEEMYRQELDKTNSYSNKQIFSGEVCVQNENCGYWGSSVRGSYANPFLIKVCKTLWGKFPSFLITAETWGSLGESEEREINIIKSGAIPRLFKLPIAIASIFGENLKKDGTLNKTERKNVNVIKKWIEYTNKSYPSGSILIQSTTYNAWPYPALIFKRGTWAAVDLFFTLPDIPMTFMGEEEGLAFREKTTNVFSYASKQENIEIKLNDPTQQKVPERRMKKIESFIHSDDLGFGYNTYNNNISVMQKYITSQESQKPLRVYSGTSLSQMELSNIETAQENFRREVGPQFGFDLKQIGKHYQHRRLLRKQHRVFRNGILVSLSAEHMYGWHTHVLAFARYSKEEMALVAINFNDGEVDMFLNLSNLKLYFPNYLNSDVVVRLRNWSNPEKEQEDISYYFIGEFLEDRLEAHLINFQSQIWGVEIFIDDKEKQAKAQESSLLRLKIKLTSQIPLTIYGNDNARQLILLSSENSSLQKFVNGFGDFYKNIIEPQKFDLNRLISQMKVFQTNKTLLCRLFGFFQSALALPEAETKLPFYQNLKNLIQHNKLGPIVFCTPELGKWTTTGGLGVMVDELTQELAKMNEEVYVITPYYHRNKKGETGYLLQDGFKYAQNIDVYYSGTKVTIGMNEGTYNKVKIFWLHNEEYFPSAYCGDDPKYVIKQLTVYAKGCLELLCQLKLSPSIIVTNDWFCGLIPGYLRVKRYGDFFNGTKTFHIAHNLDPLYEGRLYPNPTTDGDLSYIHELPNEFFIDPYWDKLVVNPSRCPLIACDNWGTVSQSYKYELLQTSPLAPVLKKYPNPFAFPNGIRREARFKLIVEKTNNDHLAAKEIIQKKYFGCQGLENNIAVLGFVGRVTKQKGVHLILEVAEELIRNSNGQVQVLVGGPADIKEEYSAYCANEMYRLRHIYPRNFWADPTLFFTDGTIVNVGCDFALMPSMFEPGGIVQHEFFIGSTPVIAYKTGGLRDTVQEYDQKQMKGSGFVFETYTRSDFLFAIHRALDNYHNEQHYAQLRKNAFEAAIDVADVGRAWAQEFYRLFEKNYIDKEFVQIQQDKIIKDYKEYKEEPQFKKEKGRVFTFEDKQQRDFEKILAAAKRSNLIYHTFQYRTSKIPQPRQVSVSGSFDEWKEKHKLKYDHFSKLWNITLQLHPGEYFYKFYVDNEWVCSEEDLKDNDIYGNINNFVIIQ